MDFPLNSGPEAKISVRFHSQEYFINILKNMMDFARIWGEDKPAEFIFKVQVKLKCKNTKKAVLFKYTYANTHTD